MTNKKFWLGTAVIALTFSFILTSCPAADSEEKDTWSKITSLSQMDGTWKGSFKYTTSISDMRGGDEEDGEDGGGMFDDFDDIKVTTTVEMTTVFNAAAKTQAGSSKSTMAFSGGKIKEVWPMIKFFITDVGEPEEGVTVTADDSKYTITRTASSAAEPIPDENIAELLSQNLQINQKGNKIKIPAGVMEEGTPEIILSKQ
jgi:hypothetical protein